MRNRAKCKLCNEIVESLFSDDMQVCSCKEIGIWGGDKEYLSTAKDYSNFIRIDDDNKEIQVKYIEKREESEKTTETSSSPIPPTMDEMIKTVEDMIQSIQDLPESAKWQSTNQYDLISVYYILLGFFKASKSL